MKRIDRHRMGFATVLFSCVLGAHVALPQPATFALALLVLSVATLIVLEQTRAGLPLILATRASSDTQRDVAHVSVSPSCTSAHAGEAASLDAALAGIEAELHTLIDQYRTEIEPALSGWTPPANCLGSDPR